MKTIGYIGGGRITRIMLQGFRNAKISIDKFSICDTNLAVLEALKTQYPEIAISSADPKDAASAEIVFIALHPPAIMDALESVKGYISTNAIVVSLAPKITLEKISVKLGHTKVVRLIPNATSFVNEGYNPVCFSNAISATEKSQLMDILNVLGKTFETAENKLEGYAIMSAMLPTYFWFQWKKLAELGATMNLDEKECTESIQQTMEAALKTFYKSGLRADEVMDLIPVKPIGEHEAQITGVYEEKLKALYEKIRS